LFSLASTPVPVGPEFRVNTTTLNDQGNAVVAADRNGNFVIVWASDDGGFTPAVEGGPEGGPTPTFDVYAQRYNASGAPLGTEFRVNTTTANDQRLPAVAFDQNGNFVIAWSSVQDGSAFGVYARRYNAAGAPLTGEVPVNTFTTMNQAGPSIAMDPAGDFVVTWTSYGEEAAYDSGVYARRFSAAMAPQGGEIHVNTFTSSIQRDPAVGMSDGGNFVVAWESFDQDGSSIGVYAQRYNSAGARTGSEFRVNTFTSLEQNDAAVAADGAGNFVVTWTSRGQDGSIDGVYARRYNASGVAQGGEFKVNTFTTDVQRAARVSMDHDGDFVVTWQSRQDGSEYGVYAQRYTPGGTPDGAEFRVNTFTTGTQGAPVVAMDFDGDFVIAWVSIPQDGSGFGVYAQRFASPLAPAVINSNFLFETLPLRLTFQFSQDVSASLSLSDFVIQKLPGGPTITPSGLSWDATTNTATLTFGGVLADGNYRATLLAGGITNSAGTALSSNVTFDFFALAGDANRDRRVDLLDFNILSQHFGQSNRVFSEGNFNYDGMVDLLDFNILSQRFGQTVGPETFGGTSISSGGKLARLLDGLRQDELA
jgi:hypothetical protein